MALGAKNLRESPTAPKKRTDKPTKAELAAMRKGEEAFARGEVLTLAEFLDEMDRNRRKAGAKTGRKVSR
jgi:hypothetical protein